MNNAPPNITCNRQLILALTASIGWILFWYRETFAGIVDLWIRSDTYTHGFVVAPIALWLIWRDRDRFAGHSANPTLLPALPAAFLGFGWILGQLTAVNAISHFCVVGLIVLTIVALLGIPISKRIAFPLLFLFFAVPIGEFMMPSLMQGTAHFTVLALRASGIPVYQEGLQFVIPSGSWSVVEACSGIRYMIASFMVGSLYAYLNYTSLNRRLIFIAVSLVVPIIANWLRAYLIVLLGHVSSNQLATGADHLVYGWVFFGIVMAALFAIGMRWSEEPDLSPRAPASCGASNQGASPWPAMLVMAIIVVAAPFAYDRLAVANGEAHPDISLPALSEGWEVTLPFSDWKPSYAKPSSEREVAFAKDGKAVGIYIAFYRNQNFERKLITSTNLLVQYQDRDWAIARQQKQVRAIGGRTLSVVESEIAGKSDSQRLIAYSWFWINGHLTTSPMLGKLYTALAMLTGRGDDSALVVVYAPLAPDRSTSLLDNFLEKNADRIHAAIEHTRDDR